MFEHLDDIVTPAEAAEALKVGMNRLYELLSNGELKGFRNGRVWLVPRESLGDYVRTQAKLK